ncbi:TPA: small membrane protein [Pluralibacter gergoviae]|nr:small membrane protein [Pluralibacter gergoviae]HDS1149799.1 small membrane protein [Pluralibacter gergoviae]
MNTIAILLMAVAALLLCISLYCLFSYIKERRVRRFHSFRRR